jgi:hypothetical protein
MLPVKTVATMAHSGVLRFQLEAHGITRVGMVQCQLILMAPSVQPEIFLAMGRSMLPVITAAAVFGHILHISETDGEWLIPE